MVALPQPARAATFDGEAGRTYLGQDLRAGVEDALVGPGVAGTPGPTESGLIPVGQQIAGVGRSGVRLDVGHRSSVSGAGAARRSPSPSATAARLVRWPSPAAAATGTLSVG
jgi:hypothetical protein